MSEAQVKTQPRGLPTPRFRFSLRALMLVAVTVCCVLAWFSSQTRLMMRQQQAVERIRQWRGHATYAHQLEGKPPPLLPVFMRKLLGDVVMSPVVKVSWHATHASDEDTNVLAELPHVKDLRLNSAVLSDAGMAPVARLTKLKRLDLWCSQVTDESMPHLSNLRQLERLSLRSTQVTDEGLKSLASLGQLRELNLRHTNVTPSGVEWLQRELPGCKISGVEAPRSQPQ